MLEKNKKQKRAKHSIAAKMQISMKTKQKVVITLIVGIILTIAIAIWDYKIANEPITSLPRGAIGTTGNEEALIAEDQSGQKFNVTIAVPEQIYTSTEAQTMFAEIMLQLDDEILADNQAFDNIQSDMYLPTVLPGRPVQIDWSSSKVKILDWTGQLGENISENGEEVQLTAEIKYRDETVTKKWELRVFPRLLSENETQKKKIVAAAEEKNVNQSSKTFDLPDNVEGRPITWFPFHESSSGIIAILTIVVMGGFILGNKQEEDKARQKREIQMQIDYPEILSKLILLMNAGMSMRRSFAKVALDYKKQKAEAGRKKYYRYAYEEFLITYNEMEHGVLEVEAYERLGDRCDLAIYKMFSVLLIQNLKKGNQKMLEAMEREMTTAFEERKRRAKVIGEQAATKLLLPMMIMLVIVFILLMVPAFLSF